MGFTGVEVVSSKSYLIDDFVRGVISNSISCCTSKSRKKEGNDSRADLASAWKNVPFHLTCCLMEYSVDLPRAGMYRAFTLIDFCCV